MPLETGQKVKGEMTKITLAVKRKLGEGTQGEVYLVEGPHGQQAIKWYKPAQATLDQMTAIRALVQAGPPRGAAGARFAGELMDLDDEFGVRSSFQVVPDARWSSGASTKQFINELKRRGFEVNVHDLTHDGHLFRNRERFLRHATTINARGRSFGSRGFRSGAMYRRQDWLSALDISYDMSVPNVAHLEPQAGGCCTVMPFFMGHVLELPLTAAQDYTVFHVLGDYSTRLWQEQIDRVLEQNGLVSFIAHPDYLIDPRAREVYTELLRLLVGLRAERQVWTALPAEIDRITAADLSEE